jgi:phosphotransacetylase
MFHISCQSHSVRQSDEDGDCVAWQDLVQVSRQGKKVEVTILGEFQGDAAYAAIVMRQANTVDVRVVDARIRADYSGDFLPVSSI